MPTVPIHYARWTSEEDAKLAELVAKGCSDRIIGRELGRTSDSVKQRRLSIIDNRESKRWTAEDDAYLLKAKASGMLDREIGRELARSAQAVRRRRQTIQSMPVRDSRIWTADEDEKIVTMFKSGAKPQDIADAVGRSKRATIQRKATLIQRAAAAQNTHTKSHPLTRPKPARVLPPPTPLSVYWLRTMRGMTTAQETS
jgi:IS30 family transposase